ncbi:putative quinol monooxygenase [Halarcobacter sp.]|uniref:putative quinol monooxygenase n=1 Tax=Halarcobacter sp. TaxID=2321133 RepID=UPI002AAAFCCA|nr:putative quinol monooxygenase [Halarcobacter sp.]
MKNVIVVANITIKEEFTNEVYKALVELHEKTNKYDEGCISYELHKELGKDNSFTFIEIWENEEFLKNHTQKEHFLKFSNFIDGKVFSMNVQKLEKINF